MLLLASGTGFHLVGKYYTVVVLVMNGALFFNLTCNPLKIM